MQENNNPLYRKLSILFWINILAIIIVFVVVLLSKGAEFGDIPSDVAFERWAIIVTIAAIPIGLKGYHSLLRKKKEQEKKDDLPSYYTKLYLGRLLLFDLITAMNIVGFQLYESNNFIYLTIVIIFAMLFTLPNRNELSSVADLPEEPEMLEEDEDLEEKAIDDDTINEELINSNNTKS